MILSLDSRDSPELDALPHHMPHALLVAFSPCGDYGLQRKPRESHWEIVRPFGFEQLMQLIQEPHIAFGQAPHTPETTLEDVA